MLDHAEALAYYDHPFFGRWPAITRNSFGRGSLTYEGTYLSDRLQQNMLRRELEQDGLPAAGPDFPKAVRVRAGVNGMGRSVHDYLNLSSSEVSAPYRYGAGTELLAGTPVRRDGRLRLAPWGVAIVEEQATSSER